MATTLSQLQLGGADDTVALRIGDADIKIAESYEVKLSVLQQPSAFSLRLGWQKSAAEILKLAAPNKPFVLTINGRKVASGTLDARAVPSANYTQVEVRGRDYLAHVFDSFVEDEESFTDKTYADLTRSVLNAVGMTEAKGHRLQVINDANRQLITGVPAPTREQGQLATQLYTNAMSGTGQVVFQTPMTKTGTRYYDFLLQQYKLAGLFLWASPDKSFVLARPHANQPASYNIFRARGGDTNVVDCHFNDDTTMRHAVAVVFGKSGGGKHGVEICRGAFVDDEMVGYGFTKTIVQRDADVKSQEECEYVARRILSEERRAGWRLEYTLAGHTVPSPKAPGGLAVWGPDTVVRVDDDELHVVGEPALNFHKDFYLEAVTFARNPYTTTRLTLMRPSDLLFATSLNDDGGAIARKQRTLHGRTLR